MQYFPSIKIWEEFNQTQEHDEEKFAPIFDLVEDFNILLIVNVIIFSIHSSRSI